MSGVRVVLVEDHSLARTGLRIALRAEGFEVVGESADGVSAQQLIFDLSPDVVVIDIGIPAKDGIEVTRAIRLARPQTRVLMLSMKEDQVTVQGALSAGADGYCLKSSDTAIIVAAVRAVASGAAYFDSKIAAMVLARLNGSVSSSVVSPLTNRETEILTLIAEGVANNDIGERIFISYGTVKAHVAEILRKMAARDRAHAVAIALRNGFIV